MKWHQMRVALPTALLVSLLGCSSDTATAEDFRRKANEACRATSAESEPEVGAVPDPGEMKSRIEGEILPDILDLADELEQIERPSHLDTSVRELVEQVRAGVALVQEHVDDRTSMGRDPFAEANRLARELGLTDCVN